MADTLMVIPGTWSPVAENLWVYVDLLDDPLLRATEVRVDVYEAQGRTRLQVVGNNAGVCVAIEPAPPGVHADGDGGQG